MTRSKLKKDKWYCKPCIKREVRISWFFILSLLALATFVGMMTSVTSCFVSTHVVRVPYSSQARDIAAAVGTTCVKCGTDTTSRQWFNCKDKPGTKLCKPCYEKNQLDIAAAAGTTCVKCRTDTTIKLHSCKDEPGTKICMSCYDKNRLDVAAAAGTTCVECGTDTTSRWINWKAVPGTKTCMSCYLKNRSNMKKVGNAKEE